jgi:hypothetical protein
MTAVDDAMLAVARSDAAARARWDVATGGAPRGTADPVLTAGNVDAAIAAHRLRSALAALEAARTDERAADAAVDAADASESSTAVQRDAAAEWYATARATRIRAERAAEEILAALPDATARRAALYAAGVR